MIGFSILAKSRALLFASTLATGFGQALTAAAEPDLGASWEVTARGLFKDSHASFAVADGPEARFGEAVTLLNLQPKTDGNLNRAAMLLEGIATDFPADDLGISALYYLARIDQIHRSPADTGAAVRRYRELEASGSPHPLAQRALVQLAILELFESGVSAAEVRKRFDLLTGRGERLHDSAARRDFHLVLAEAAQRLGLGDEAALVHLLAADRAGFSRAITRRDAWIRIAELARATGRVDLASEYYRRFLEHFQRDSRRFMIQRRLEELNASAEETP